MNASVLNSADKAPDDGTGHPCREGEGANCLISRRHFLLSSGMATFAVMVPLRPEPAGAEQEVPAAVATYPRKFIARLSELEVDRPVDFRYPDEEQYADNMLVKLGRTAGGGIGPDSDVVALNYTCTHQGGPLHGSYKAGHKVLGPCPLHLSTFDLTRHGIVVSGQAYESLPQVLLELDGDDIYAVGVMGLIFGRSANLPTKT
jgi:arsenite oxidase small subunit